MKIFIIDDDQLSVHLTRTILTLEGITQDITAFLSAGEALEVLNANNDMDMPAVILLDLNMPEMDGWDFLDALQPLELPLNNKCKIFILTSSLDPADTERAAGYSVVAGFIQKPLNSEDIKAIVRIIN